MIAVQNTVEKKHKVDTQLIRQSVTIVLDKLKSKNSALTIRLTDDQEIKNLNNTYRSINKPTDVLSFEQNFIDPETGDLYLGDIIISVDQAGRQAKERDHSLSLECAFLAIHGTLHLLGYDHIEPEEKILMWQLQEDFFEKIKSNPQG